MDTLTASDVLDLLDDHIEKLGADYKGRPCYYSALTGTPECANGLIFNDLGFSRERVGTFLANSPLWLHEHGLLPEFTAEAAQIMEVIMDNHDEPHGNLGLAREAAKKAYDEIAAAHDFKADVPELVDA